MAQSKGIILVSAGGTGGHLFPAEALSHELARRGWAVHLATDHRAQKYADNFPAEKTHVIEAASPSGKNPFKMLAAAFALYKGIRTSKVLLEMLKPHAVVGFGGYPTVPPLVAASNQYPTMIHEQNAVAGRANKLLAGRVTAIAGGFLKAQGEHSDKIVETGNPVRPPVLAAADIAYKPPAKSGKINLVIFGGSQGANFFSTEFADGLALLPAPIRQRLHVTQQARPEDRESALAKYRDMGVEADVSPFFTDLAERIGKAHLVVARSGASTVSEVSVIGRPSILVPYPHALDHDQAANAEALAEAGGALVRKQGDMSAQSIAEELESLLSDSAALKKMAQAAKAAGRPDAAILLADLTEAIASGQSVAAFKAATNTA